MRSGRIGKRIDSSQADHWLPLAVRYLARWDRTTAQVEQFLLHRGASPAQAKRTVGRLADLRYLNDRGFADRWIESRLARSPMGRERLRAELLAKGVNETVTDRAVREAFRERDEDTLARRALKIAQRTGRRLTPLQSLRLLRQRGFEEETIDRMIRDRFEDEGSDR